MEQLKGSKMGCSITRFARTIDELQLTMYEIDQLPENIVIDTIFNTYNELGEEKVETMKFHMWVFEVKKRLQHAII